MRTPNKAPSKYSESRHRPLDEIMGIDAESDFRGKSIPRAKRWLIIYPNGQTKEIINLRRFCRENGLNRNAMRKIAHNLDVKVHRGFRCKLLEGKDIRIRPHEVSFNAPIKRYPDGYKMDHQNDRYSDLKYL